jgi:hypothetical protein
LSKNNYQNAITHQVNKTHTPQKFSKKKTFGVYAVRQYLLFGNTCHPENATTTADLQEILTSILYF